MAGQQGDTYQPVWMSFCLLALGIAGHHPGQGPGFLPIGGGDLLKTQPPSSSASVAASSTASQTPALCFVTESLSQESLC